MNQALLEKLQRCTLREAKNVLTLLGSGASMESESGSKASPTALLETYEVRSEHLAQFTSHHANRLKLATDEFCANLAAWDQEQSVGYARVDDSLLGSYVVWYVVDPLTPIGCLYVIGKSEVSSREWESVWNDA